MPSLLRGFSAPVVLDYAFSDGELLTQLAHDTDAFNRWEAGQRLALRYALQAIQASGSVPAQVMPDDFIQALRHVLRHATLDAAYKDLVLTLPSETYMA